MQLPKDKGAFFIQNQIYTKLPFLIGLRKGRQERRNDIIEISLNSVNTLTIDIF